MWEVTKTFKFEAAHTLQRKIAAEGSRRIHGHSYRAEIALRGTPAPNTGMVMDLGAVSTILEAVRDDLDHHFLDEVSDLGPATMENLAKWIWERIVPSLPYLSRVTIYRDSLDESATYFGPVQP